MEFKLKEEIQLFDVKVFYCDSNKEILEYNKKFKNKEDAIKYINYMASISFCKSFLEEDISKIYMNNNKKIGIYYEYKPFHYCKIAKIKIEVY